MKNINVSEHISTQCFWFWCFPLQYNTNICEDSNAICKNTPGSYICETCESGYKARTDWTSLLSTFIGECVDINECEEDEAICGDNSICQNTEGSFDCQCKPGYKQNPDIIEFDCKICVLTTGY